MAKMGEEKTISEIVKSIIDGEMAHRLGTVCKVIVPIKRVEIRKTEVLEMGSEPQDQPVFAPEPVAEPAAEEAPAEPVAEVMAEPEQ
jgi:small subunit ribosomal protein S3Ae